MVQQQSLENIVEDHRTILRDILPLFAEGTPEQMARAVDMLVQQEDWKYRMMMQELERQCDKYMPKVGETYLREYGLTAKDPTEARRYFIVLNYIKTIAEGNDCSRSLAAKRIATMEPREYAYAIQVLRSAKEHPNRGEEAKKLLWKVGELGFIPVQQQAPQGGTYGRERDVYNPATATRAREGRNFAFATLHYGDPNPMYRR